MTSSIRLNIRCVVHLATSCVICAFLGCDAATSRPVSENVVQEQPETMQLTAGGIYASQDDDGKYTLSKILALDDLTVHARFYKERFDSLPAEISSKDLSFLIGHAPVAREGFLLEHRELVVVEPVSDAELEGYRMYLEAMRGN